MIFDNYYHVTTWPYEAPPPKAKPEDQALGAIEDVDVQKQEEGLAFTELDNEIECPRCHEFMELQSSFDKLMYSCESCSFLLKCA